MTKAFLRPFGLLTLALLTGLTLTACASTDSTGLTADRVPPEFSLKLYRHLEGGRHTYFTLDAAGELSFAGGRLAIARTPSPVLTLTPAQRQAIWAIIVNEKLFDVKGQKFKTGQHATFDVDIKTRKGLGSKNFRVTDDHIPPGVKKLHGKLFDLQAQERYRQDLPNTIRQEDRTIE